MTSSMRGAILLAMAVLLALMLLATVNKLTEKPIKESRQQWLLNNLAAVLPPGPFDSNPALSHRQHVQAALGSTEPLDIYTAYQSGKPVAAVLEVIAPHGYSGNIRLLMGVRPDGELIAARVIEHRETPGLGDKIDSRKSDWIMQFDGQSTFATTVADWQMKKEGGNFDALTGATITSNAVAQALFRALDWYTSHRSEVFDSEGIVYE